MIQTVTDFYVYVYFRLDGSPWADPQQRERLMAGRAG